MSITSDASTLVLQAVIEVTFDKIDNVALFNGGTEIFRKAVTDITIISSTKQSFIFFINESEGNGSITQIKLLGNNVVYATQPLSLTKDSSQSLLINWGLEVK